MDYTLAGIRNRVMKDKLDEEEYDESILNNFINDTIFEIFTSYELPFQEKIYSGTLPSGVHMFSLPDDVSVIQSRMVTSSNGLYKNIDDLFMPFRDFNQKYMNNRTNQPGEPGIWTTYANKMILSQPTDQDYTLDLYYTKKPSPLLNDSDVPEIPIEFQESVVLGAYMRVQRREGDHDLALTTERSYYDSLSRMVARYGSRHSNKPQKIRLGNR